MRFHTILAVILCFPCSIGARATQKPGPGPNQHTTTSAAEKIEVEKVQPSGGRQAPPAGTELGYMEPDQVKDYLHKVYLAEYRVNDLLSQVHPENWELSDATRASISKTMETLRGELTALEQWRGQFEKRTDSMYLGFETYAALGATLPRLDGVAQSITQHENASLGAQYSQAVNQLLDLQQAIRPYLTYLLGNQDQLLVGAQNNLASCQKQLGLAMRGRAGSAKPIRNTMIGRPTGPHSSTKSTKGEHKISQK